MYKQFVKLRSAVLVFLTHHLALPLLKLLTDPQKFPYTRHYLAALPDGSLGKALITMLDDKQLKLLPYYVKHDIKHILLQYDTTDEGEVCLQCFMLGNGHWSFPVVATVLFGLLTMPEYWASFRMAYRRGQQAPCISHWQWFTLLHQQVVTLVAGININQHG